MTEDELIFSNYPDQKVGKGWRKGSFQREKDSWEKKNPLQGLLPKGEG